MIYLDHLEHISTFLDRPINPSVRKLEESASLESIQIEQFIETEKTALQL